MFTKIPVSGKNIVELISITLTGTGIYFFCNCKHLLPYNLNTQIFCPAFSKRCDYIKELTELCKILKIEYTVMK